jgi:DNA-binding NarL/FixJ family response regulator
MRGTKLIGRDAELAVLRRMVRDAVGGRGGCILLLGEAGTGKTRILRELAHEAEGSGVSMLRGEAPGVAAPPSWGVIAQALRTWTRAHALPAQELGAFVPGLRQILPEWPSPPELPPQLDEDQMRMLILEGAFRLVVQAARPSGALVLLDDMQDADAESLAFLHHACVSVASEPVAIVCAVRTGESRRVEEQLRSFERRGLARLIELSPLRGADVSAMIGELLGRDPPSGLVADVIARTDGIPLLVEHLIQDYLGDRTLQVTDDGIRWTGDARARSPRATTAYVRHRTADLSREARRVLIAAAITGRFDHWLLAAAAGVEERSIPDALAAAESTGLIEMVEGSRVFRHALVRDAIAALATRDEAIEVHRSAADAFEARALEDPVSLEARARHLEATGDKGRAARVLVRAARAALADHAPQSAGALARRALSLDPDDNADARGTLAEALGQLGRASDALTVDREAKVADPVRLERMARNAVSAGMLDEADALVVRAIDAGAPRAVMLSVSALAALWRGRLDEATAHASQALSQAERDRDARTVCAALDVIGRSADARGERDVARAAFRRWADEAAAAGLTASRLQALMELGNLDFLSGGSAQGLSEARALAIGAGSFSTIVLADLSLVWWLGHRGRVVEAIDLGNEAIDICRRFELDLLPHAFVATAWAHEHIAVGSGERFLEEASAVAPEDVDLVILAGWIRGDSALRMGDFARAIEAYQPAMGAMRAAPSAVPPPVPFMLACAHFAAGDREHGLAALEEARSSPALPRLYVNQMWLAVAEALAAASGDSLRAATELARENGPFNVAVALVLGAATIDGADGDSWLREALSSFESFGADSDCARVRKLLRARGAPVPRKRKVAATVPEDLRVLGITESEFDVLKLIAEGLSNPEIANRRFLSVRTVEDKVSALLRKLGASNRAALIARGLTLTKVEMS